MMKVALWAEIHRLHEMERLSQAAIARRLHCSHRTVRKALSLSSPPASTRGPSESILDAYRAQIDALVAKYPDLSAVRVREEISRGEDGYRGSVYPVRRVSVFVAVLCYSRLCYIEFSLSQRKADFYRAVVHALQFFQGSPRKIIFDNLKAAVTSGSGRYACLHPEFLALCGHFCMEPIACAARDPESKGIVEGGVRYVKRNALAGRNEELATWEDYRRLAVQWRDEVANVRLHAATKERPIDRFQKERPRLRPLPAMPFDTDEVLSVVVTPHARIHYDGNRYSVPPGLVRKPVMLRVSEAEVRILDQGQEVARHARCYEKGQLIVDADQADGPFAEAVGAGATRRPPGGVGRHPPSPPVPDLGRGLCRGPPVTRAPPPRASLAHALAAETSRTDRRHSPGRARPGPLRPAVRRF